MTLPVISVVGSSNSGKTTLIGKLIPALKKRGYRVGTIKHNRGDFEIDYPGKDTWVHRQAGADMVMIASARRLAIIETLEEEPPLEDLLQKVGKVDLVITEGYKRENKPKIEVIRGREAPLCQNDKDGVLAYVVEAEHWLGCGPPCFNWSQLDKLVELIEQQIIGGV